MAPIIFLPVLLTVFTGSLFQVAVLTGKGNDFLWLLELHKGNFGRIRRVHPIFASPPEP
ncbi:MAG: hypothetical protein EBE86_008690 [Hormoscilla sp. GUM202]|nr:hypothetical protein [Hormoscilla sp. GUM202]